MVCSILPFLPSLTSTSDITGINVVLIVFNKKLPIRVVADKAMKKVSVCIPEPNLDAISISLRNPKILLTKENTIIINADLAVLLDLFIIYPLIFNNIL